MNHLKKVFWQLRLALLRENIFKNLRKLNHFQRLDQENVSSTQKQRLRNLLSHAYHNVPYYREVLAKSGVVNKSVGVALDDFSKIPFLTKDIIRLRFEDLKSKDLPARKWYENTSGGSTGEPVRFIQDKEYHGWLTAVKILFDLWSGYRLSEKKICLWGSERDIFRGGESSKIKFGRWLSGERWINAFRMTPLQMRDFVNQINNYKPIQILAYAENIYELSHFIAQEGLTVYNPKSIMTSAGTLHQHMREIIEKIFKAPVFNRYGSREVGDIACECVHHRGLHVSAHTHYIEIIRPDNTPAENGEEGEIVVTLLTNYAMPLIRYRIGDMGEWAENHCACGISWPLLKKITGRVTDIFLIKDFTKINGEYFTHLFYFQDWVKKFQVIQEDFEYIRILIVPRENRDNFYEYYSQELEVISNKIYLVMGSDCRIKYEFVDDIAPTGSGKYRYTISKVIRRKGT